MATHVLQFVFLGNNGFRFPFAHFPTTEVDPSTLYTQFWKAVGWLRRFGFQSNFCCCDGGEANRSFIKMHFKGKDPVKERFTTINPYTRMPMVFLLDPSVSFIVFILIGFLVFSNQSISKTTITILIININKLLTSLSLTVIFFYLISTT